MATDAAFDLSFAEQIEFFRRKLNLPSEKWDDLLRAAHDRAFVVAGATKADLLADLRAAVQAQMDGGRGLEGFRDDFLKIVDEHGWWGFTGDDRDTDRPKGAGGIAWRTRVIYDTNVNTSYAAGRYQQLQESGLRYWVYKHSGSW